MVQKFIPLFLAIAVLLAVAAAPGVLNQPAAPLIQSTQNGGELEITWDAIPGAQFYTVGWINWTEGAPVHASGGDWLSLFHYTTVAGDRTSYTVKGQNGGDNHYAIIRATDVGGTSGRFGGGYSTWSAWSSAPAQPAGHPTPGDPPATDCVDDGTCIPIQRIGTFAGSGDSVEHVFPLQAGVYRFTASRTNIEGNFFIDVIELSSGDSRSVGIYGRDQTSGQEALTIYGPDRSFGLKAGNYVLDVDTDHDWSVRVELIQAHSTQSQSSAACTGDDYDRDEWGDYPAVDANATPRWTTASDDVTSRDITQDHHVALKDAHISGGCDWSATKKDQFSSDAENLNPTTRSFSSSKANRTPDMLTGIALGIIDTDAEKCDYATQHDEVKGKYSLTMTTAEQSTVDEWLTLCP